MDKLTINFSSQKDSLYEYELRIPEDFNWFVIRRHNKESDNYDTDFLVYNGNTVLLYGYYYKDNQKITKYYDEYQDDKVKKEMVIDLLNSIGINCFSLNLLDKLGFETKHLKRKYWKQYYFNGNIKYILKENISNGNEESIKYDILDASNEENQFGEISINNDRSKITIFPNMTINISELYKSKICEFNKVRKLN